MKVLDQLSQREKSIAAAAYLKGLCVALAIRGSTTWHGQVKGSRLAEAGATNLLGGLDQFLSDGKDFNPLMIYDRDRLAFECGLIDEHQEACAKLRAALTPPRKAPPKKAARSVGKKAAR